MTNIMNYPRQEDVTEVNLGKNQVAIVKLTDENRKHMLEVYMSMSLGEHCKYCDKEYTTIDELKDTVYAGSHERGRLACKKCWDKNNDKSPTL